MGKRKIAIEKIEDKQRRNVTFSKRREGLFKKAETACQKFGLKIGIVVFSPAGKPFTFCNSSSVSVDAIIDGYMSSSSSSAAASVVVGKRSRSVGDDDDVQVIETEKKKQKTTMNAVVTPCITTVQEEEEEEKLDEGFHYKNVVDSADHGFDMNEEEEDEDYGYTVEEWEQILSTSSTSVVGNSTLSPYMHQEEVVPADYWPTEEFLHHLHS